MGLGCDVRYWREGISHCYWSCLLVECTSPTQLQG